MTMSKKFTKGDCGHFCEACARRDDKITVLYEALKRAREYVVDNRNSIADSHRNLHTGLLEPADVCAIDDALLFEIDTAIAKAAP